MKHLDFDKMKSNRALQFSSSLATIALFWSDFSQQSQHLRFLTSWLLSKQNLQITLGEKEGRCTDQGGRVGEPS
jgi:hypothetical protein